MYSRNGLIIVRGTFGLNINVETALVRGTFGLNITAETVPGLRLD